AVVLRQDGLVVVGVDVADAALHEEEDDALDLRRVMGALGRERVDDLPGGGVHPREGQGAEPAGAVLQEATAAHHPHVSPAKLLATEYTEDTEKTFLGDPQQRGSVPSVSSVANKEFIGRIGIRRWQTGRGTPKTSPSRRRRRRRRPSARPAARRRSGPCP